jgi:hypothetical protein
VLEFWEIRWIGLVIACLRYTESGVYKNDSTAIPALDPYLPFYLYVCHHQTKQQDLFSESLSMVFSIELHGRGYCLLGSLIETFSKLLLF